jgi:hypothetical protein
MSAYVQINNYFSKNEIKTCDLLTVSSTEGKPPSETSTQEKRVERMFMHAIGSSRGQSVVNRRSYYLAPK